MLMRNLRVVDTSQAKFFALLKISELSLLWLTDHRVVVLLVHGQTKKKGKKIKFARDSVAERARVCEAANCVISFAENFGEVCRLRYGTSRTDSKYRV